MDQTVREGGVEHDRQPVFRNNLAVLNGEALRCVHPAVGGEDPEGRHQRAECDHAGREEMQPRADLIPAKHHDAEETGFQEEGG